MLCHTYGRGKDTHIMVSGWPYSLVTALETGRSSWTAPLDARRLAPGDDAATITADQLRGVVERLIVAGHWQPGDADMWIVADAGYDGPRLAFLLTDLPVNILVRMRSDRALRRPAPARAPGTTGRPGTAASSSSAIPPAGVSPTRLPRPTPASTAPQPLKPGTGCIRG